MEIEAEQLKTMDAQTACTKEQNRFAGNSERASYAKYSKSYSRSVGIFVRQCQHYATHLAKANELRDLSIIATRESILCEFACI